MSKLNRAADFLENMKLGEPETPSVAPKIAPLPARPSPTSVKAASSRTGLKHIGGYFDPETVEKVAVLRARLRLDNSELIKLAIDDLHRTHLAKRAFGDV